MAEQQRTEKAAALTLEQVAMVSQIAASIASEMRKPFVDEDIVRRNEASRARIREQRDESERNKAAIQDQCSHLREDNTSRIAWHQFHHVKKKLFIYEGYCQLCNKHYHPGVPGYEQMIKIPSGKPGIIS